jgi:LuxR family transcriptional regulator, maltose regulon positive regulatory protein
MSWKTPIVEDGLLREPARERSIPLGSAEWYAWLAEDGHRSFHFTHVVGAFTARKERKQRGQWYWVAYRQLDCKLHKLYLGKGEGLTEERLVYAAHELARQCAGGE